MKMMKLMYVWIDNVEIISYCLDHSSVSSKIFCFSSPTLLIIEKPMNGVPRILSVTYQMICSTCNSNRRRSRSYGMREVGETSGDSDTCKGEQIVNRMTIFS